VYEYHLFFLGNVASSRGMQRVVLVSDGLVRAYDAPPARGLLHFPVGHVLTYCGPYVETAPGVSDLRCDLGAAAECESRRSLIRASLSRRAVVGPEREGAVGP